MFSRVSVEQFATRSNASGPQARPAAAPSGGPRPRLACLAAIAFLIWPFASQAQTSAVGRPILFVHGWCSDATDWQFLEPFVLDYLTSAPSLAPLYPKPQTFTTLYYD